LDCQHFKTGNCLTTNDNEGLFDINGLTSYQKRKAKINHLMGSSKQLSINLKRVKFVKFKSVVNSSAAAFTEYKIENTLISGRPNLR